jgi:hypothetical protein
MWCLLNQRFAGNRLEKFDEESLPDEFQDLVKCSENLYVKNRSEKFDEESLRDEFQDLVKCLENLYVKNRLEKFDAESFPCEFQDLVKCLENLFEESLVHVSHSKNLYDEFLWKEMMPSKEFHNV